ADSPAPVDWSKKFGTILLIDDEKMILDVGCELLEELGYTVLCALSGKEALDIFKTNSKNIDLVIMDMIMPGMGGGETFDHLRDINPDIKVLLSSGYSVDGQATKILRRGCNGFIQKPFNLNQLSEKIGKIMEAK
ncbi:MAG: response regulator, partial [Desulfobacterales bacterium]